MSKGGFRENSGTVCQKFLKTPQHLYAFTLVKPFNHFVKQQGLGQLTGAGGLMMLFSAKK